MNFIDVSDRALRDPGFARDLARVVAQAKRDGVGSQAWIKLAKYFAENEDELAMLIPPTTKTVKGKFDTTTLTHLIILSDTFTGQTTTTTTTNTTTTTSEMCSIQPDCKGPVARAAKKRAAKKIPAKTTAKKRK